MNLGYFLKIYIFDQNSEKWLNTLKSMFFSEWIENVIH